MKNINDSLTINNMMLFSKMNNFITYSLVEGFKLLDFTPSFTYSNNVNLYINNLVIDSIDFYEDFRNLLK